MILLEFPSPLFSWIDAAWGGVLPPVARLVLWGGAGGALSLALYALVSRQDQIAETKARVAETRQRLDAHDDDFATALPILSNMLRLSSRQVWLTAGPAILSSVPLLWLIVWMSTAYQGVDSFSMGPSWVRSWELPFFSSLVIGSITIKKLLRIH